MATKKTKAKTKGKPARAAEPPQLAAKDLAKAFREEYRPAPPPASNVVTLDADVAPHFQNSRAVNEALRALLRIVRQVRSSGESA
jgi:uncharacterized protein (DUF4415 family)